MAKAGSSPSGTSRLPSYRSTQNRLHPYSMASRRRDEDYLMVRRIIRSSPWVTVFLMSASRTRVSTRRPPSIAGARLGAWSQSSKSPRLSLWSVFAPHASRPRRAQADASFFLLLGAHSQTGPLVPFGELPDCGPSACAEGRPEVDGDFARQSEGAPCGPMQAVSGHRKFVVAFVVSVLTTPTRPPCTGLTRCSRRI